MIPIRLATPNDASVVHALHRQVLGEQQWFITLPSEFIRRVADVAHDIEQLQAAPNGAWWVAHHGQRLLGFLTLRGGVLQRMRHTAKLEIMVAKSARGQGVGKALMQVALDWATAHPDLEKIGLAVFEDNTRAQALYQTFGFVQEGRRPNEYKLQGGQYTGDVLMYRMVS